MLKPRRYLLGLFLAVLWPALPLLHAEELPPPLDAAAPSQNVDSPGPAAVTPGGDTAVPPAEEEVRDPFAVTPETETLVNAPVVDSKEAALPIPVLEGIGFGSKDAYAVMGGDVFFSGDIKKGIKLLEVRRREVDILINGGKVTLPLFPGDDLKNAKDRAEKKNAVDGNTAKDQLADKPSSSSGREQLPL
jgi:hypothetical protein